VNLERLQFADLVNAKLSPELIPTSNEGLSDRFVLSVEFDEIKLFALLKWKFGSPNGPITLVGKPGGDPDGPFKWDFLFIPMDPLKLHVIRTVNGIEIRCWGGKASRGVILSYLENNLSRYKKIIDKSIQSLEEYTLILNPYVRHRAIIQMAANELSNISPQEPFLPSNIQVERAFYQKEIKDYQNFWQQVDGQALFSMLLVLESAFMAEAFLNLMLAILLRDEVKNTKKILDETVLRKWHAKIERLPVDCNFIKKSPDMGNHRIRDAKKLFDLRNLVAHSYPDRKEMKVGQIWFHHSFPILPKATPFHHFAMALSNQIPSVDEAWFCKKAAENLIAYLTELITDEVIKEFEMLSETNPLGFNEKKQLYGIPFGNFVIISSAVFDLKT
jgi:hypothetical protein